jgi:hypothetical protein
VTVAENIFIDRLRQFAGLLGFIDRRRMEAAAQAILERIGAQISVSADIGRPNLGELKCIEMPERCLQIRKSSFSTNPPPISIIGRFRLSFASSAREVRAIGGRERVRSHA